MERHWKQSHANVRQVWEDNQTWVEHEEHKGNTGEQELVSDSKTKEDITTKFNRKSTN